MANTNNNGCFSILRLILLLGGCGCTLYLGGKWIVGFYHEASNVIQFFFVALLMLAGIIVTCIVWYAIISNLFD